MNPLVNNYLNYMKNVRNAGENTLLAYCRDLRKLERYLEASGGQSLEAATATALMAYVLHLHKNGMNASTISRNIAVIKNFYKYLYYEQKISRDPAQMLRPPKVFRTEPLTLSQLDQDKLLGRQPSLDDGARTIRDHAITALMFSTKIDVGTLISLDLGDIDLVTGRIGRTGSPDEAWIKLEPKTHESLDIYIKVSRSEILKNSQTFCFAEKTAPLFINMSGHRLSRQGLWKIVKEYGRRVRLEQDLNPRMLKKLLHNQ